MSSKTKQSFITGAAILGTAALLSKILGAVYRIPYQNITGDVGLAVYNKVYPIYSMLLILATAGFPTAISKIVSERLALGDKYGAKRVFIISVYVLSLTSLIFFAILFFGSNVIAELMGNKDLSIAIKSVSFALLIVPTMAALRGYYQGHQYMTPTAISQVIEQIARVITILILSYWFMTKGYGVYYAGAGAVFGATTGAIFAFIVLVLYWRKVVKENAKQEITEYAETNFERESAFTIIKRILYYSIPIAVGSLALPILGVLDSFSVSNILIYKIVHSTNLFGAYIKGHNLVQYAEYWFGIYTRGQPLVQFAAFFATALFLALVPAISEAHAKKNVDLIKKQTELALRLTLMIGLPASIGLSVLARPVNIMLYSNGIGSDTMAILSFTTIFSTLFVSSSGILQGIGKVLLPAKNLLFGILGKLIFNVVFVYVFHVKGAALATVLTYGIITILNIRDIRKYIGIKIGFMDFFLKPIASSLIMGIVVYLSNFAVTYGTGLIISSLRLQMAIVSMVSVGVGVVSYGISLFVLGAITKKDLEQIPRHGNKLIRLAAKLKLIRN